jgi:hypothetical protein
MDMPLLIHQTPSHDLPANCAYYPAHHYRSPRETRLRPLPLSTAVLLGLVTYHHACFQHLTFYVTAALSNHLTRSPYDLIDTRWSRTLQHSTMWTFSSPQSEHPGSLNIAETLNS